VKRPRQQSYTVYRIGYEHYHSIIELSGTWSAEQVLPNRVRSTKTPTPESFKDTETLCFQFNLVLPGTTKTRPLDLNSKTRFFQDFFKDHFPKTFFHFN
jgi:hypothetical protein